MGHLSKGPLSGDTQMLRGVHRHFLQGLQGCFLRVPDCSRDLWCCCLQGWSSISCIYPWWPRQEIIKCESQQMTNRITF